MAEDNFKAGDDKFPDLSFKKLPQQLQWKLYRAKEHFEEFERKAAEWMNVGPSGPGEFCHAPESTREKPVFVYAPKEPIPARFGLIAGDYLQNLRSVLDYLVWQLILANNKIPDERKTAFPICKDLKTFEKAKVSRLVGVPDEAVTLIGALQPYPERDPGGTRPQTIHILDELTNANKHRQVLSTWLATILKPERDVPFPHIELEVIRHQSGEAIPGERLLAFLAFDGGIAKGMEVTIVLKTLMDWMGYEVLPRFERFF